jgi:hypothetical protein
MIVVVPNRYCSYLNLIEYLLNLIMQILNVYHFPAKKIMASY